MYPVNAPLLDTVSAHLLAKARTVTRQRLRQLLFVQYLSYKSAHHGMLRRTYQVKIFTLYLVHHVFHFGKGHNSPYNVAMYHERRNKIRKVLIDHKIARVVQYGGMKPCNVAFQVVEAVTRGAARGIQIYASEQVHYIGMVRNLPFGDDRFSEHFKFDIFGIVPAYRNRRIYYLRYRHHASVYFLAELLLLFFESRKLVREGRDLLFQLLSLFLFALLHKSAYLPRHRIAVCPEFIGSRLCRAHFGVHRYDLIDKRQLLILKFLSDVLFYGLRVVPDKFYI